MHPIQPAWLTEAIEFPDTSFALEDPNGLLAVGGDLSSERILTAYSKGIFPWYSDGQPILWWSPNPRMILIPSEIHIGRSNKKLFKNSKHTVTVDTAFERVMEACAEIPRTDQDGTWITDEMLEAYSRLHKEGHAHSVEVWNNGDLVGGLYGIAMGKAFFGESMFSLESGASKLGFMTLVKNLVIWNYSLIDCQVYTDYLATFGAKNVARETFNFILSSSLQDLNAPSWKKTWKDNRELKNLD